MDMDGIIHKGGSTSPGPAGWLSYATAKKNSFTETDTRIRPWDVQPVFFGTEAPLGEAVGGTSRQQKMHRNCGGIRGAV